VYVCIYIYIYIYIMPKSPLAPRPPPPLPGGYIAAGGNGKAAVGQVRIGYV